ncbi:MAG TPA: 50S ribosomal protein L24 [Candidatus Moranbacteria bacterium]|nr:50S ribosomal protein L24 [Candidatus Moranbacteria bacterium]
MRIKKGDMVRVLAGKSKGHIGKVLRVLPKAGKVVVEKANMVTKHIKAKREGMPGQKVQLEAPLDASNAMLVCPSCNKTTRLAASTGKEKARVCKKCGKEF